MKRYILAAALVSTAAFAHQGVKDPQVMARMDLMKGVGADTKIIGDMVKGATAMNLDQAHQAAVRLETAAQQIESYFAPKADDPKSEALPIIWEQWDQFLNIAGEMEAAAAMLKTADADGIREGLTLLGKSCGSCHKTYRIEK